MSKVLLVDAGSIRHKHKSTAMTSIMFQDGVNVKDPKAKNEYKKNHNIVADPRFKTYFGGRFVKDIMYFNIKNIMKFDRIVVLLEDKDNWRYDFLPTYKESRKNKPSDEHFDSKLFKKVFDEVIEDVKRLLPIEVLVVDKAEGDDLIGSIVLGSPEDEFVIMSVDKDFIQLQQFRKGVSQYSPVTANSKKNKELGHTKKGVFYPIVEKDYDLDYHILFGDTVDDIPRVKKGFGEKGIKKMLANEGIEEWKNGMKKTELKKINEAIERNKKLIDLREIPKEIQEACLKAYNGSERKEYVMTDSLKFSHKYQISYSFVNQF